MGDRSGRETFKQMVAQWRGAVPDVHWRRFETVSGTMGRFRDGRAAEHWAEQGIFPMLVHLGIVPLPAPASS